jgi:uncharacterized protein (TIGR03435 family)
MQTSRLPEGNREGKIIPVFGAGSELFVRKRRSPAFVGVLNDDVSLRLKLEKQTPRVPVLVIDHMEEKPTEN